MGCSSDEPEISDVDNTEVVSEREVSVYVYPDITEEDGVMPRMTIVDGDGYEMCTELYDPTQPEVIVYHYMNCMDNVSVFLSASAEGMTILEDDPFYSESNPPATLLFTEDVDIIIASGTYSKAGDSFAINSIRTMENIMGSASSKSLSRGDDMDFARKLIMGKIIQPLSNAVSKADGVVSKAPFSRNASLALNAINDFALPVAEAQLYSNSQDEFMQKTAEKIYSNHVSKIKCKLNVIDRIELILRTYRAGLSAYRNGVIFDGDKYEDISEPLILTTTESYSFTSRQAQASLWKVFDDSRLYKPNVRLVSVDGQSATVCGDFSNNDGRFTVTGYYLYCEGKEVQKVSAVLNGSNPQTFNNLTKGKTYQVTAYATVMGATYESPYVEFHIDGDLELSEYSLTFSEGGGSQSVQVILPSESWTWKAASDANWCKTSKTKDGNLQIKVSSASQKREATVTVTATSQRGETQIKTINISQVAIGNMALFKGKCKMYTKTIYPSKPSYNVTQENEYESALLMMRMGGSTNITFGLPLSGLTFSNWAVSNTRPSGSMLVEGYSITKFNCASTSTSISIDGATSGPNGSTNEFSVKIDLSSLCVKILESSNSTGIGYPGMAGPTEYKSHSTISGTLHYTEDYN